MKNDLIRLLQYLNNDQKNKELVELEYNEELKEVISDQKISLFTKGKTRKLFFAGLGKADTYEQKIDLVYKNKQGKLVVKPKLIQEFLDYEE